MKWYFPAWNGDVRIESVGDRTRVTVISPTEHEKNQLATLQELFKSKGWLEGPLWNPDRSAYRDAARQESMLDAPLSEVGPHVTKALKSGQQTLTAIVLQGGKVETVSGDEVPKELAKTAQEEGKAAATVKRPTPCCPQCVPGSIDPAREVLLEFLDEDQHRQWARDRTITVYGGITGKAYLLAHRHSEVAQHQGRICYAIDDELVVHFHDWTVPPEEEVLGAKLILEHREPWLRNEATMLGGAHYFKNPFGNGSDGVPDSVMTYQIGEVAARLGLFGGLS